MIYLSIQKNSVKKIISVFHSVVRARLVWTSFAASALFSVLTFMFVGSIAERAVFFVFCWGGAYLFLRVAVILASRRTELPSEERSPIELVIEKITRGDLTDELFYGAKRVRLEGRIYFLVRRMILELRKTVGKFNRLFGELETASRNLLEMTDSLAYSAREQSDSTEDVYHSLEEINNSVSEIRKNIHNLMDIVGDTSSAILEMTANIEEVTDTARNVTSYVSETATAMEEMAASVAQVAEAGRELYARASDNAASIAEMDTAIEEVSESAKLTADLSEAVNRAATEGRNAVQQTADRLRNIERSMEEATSVINKLGRQSGEIGKIVKVIKEIADQTNLLALNAAIIAAQAGKEGKGFAVVAEEIRELSERTATSVSEITAMIKSTQSEATKAVNLMETTSARVREGVSVGVRAEEALHIIQERVKLAGENIGQIVKATGEQTLGSRRITESIDDMATMIERISSATAEQATTSHKIKERAANMADATAHIFRAMEEQMAGSRAISEGMERVNAVVNSIEDAITNLAHGSEAVLRAEEVIRETTKQNTASTRALYTTVTAFRQEASLFRDVVDKFKLPEPKRGGALKFGASKSMEFNLDPAFAQNVKIADIIYNIYDGLTCYGEGTDIHPALAKRWTVSHDGVLYTFFLRDNVKFHDGKPFTATDVEASFKRVLQPGKRFPSAWMLTVIKGASRYMKGETDTLEGLRVKSAHTIEIELEEPLSFFPAYLTLAEASIIPEELCRLTGTELNAQPVGTGPFMAEEIKEGEYLRLRRNAEYFKPDIPYADELTVQLDFEDTDDIAKAFKRGELDYDAHPSTEDLRELFEDPAWAANIHSNVQLNTTFAVMRNDIPPFNDQRVRQAMNYAVNKKILIEQIHHGLHVVANGILPPGILGYNPQLKGYPFDLEKARALLREAGYPDGFKTEFYKARSSKITEENLFILSCLNEVNVEIEIKEIDDVEYHRVYRERISPIYFSGWYADYPDPDNFFYSIFNSKNQDLIGIRYSNPRVDILMEEARRETDITVRERLYRKAEELVVEDAPVIFLTHHRAYVAAQPYVGGVRLNLTPPLIRPEDLWVEK